MEKLSPEQQERLQEYLETRKISKYRIAHDLNLSASTISNYLTGKTKPDGIKWELFRNYLGISEEWIRTGQNMVSPMMKLPLKRLRPQTVWKQL